MEISGSWKLSSAESFQQNFEAREKCPASDLPRFAVRESLRREIGAVSSTCNRCGSCEKECAFLHAYGRPGEIAEGYDPESPSGQQMPFECSLCGLCSAVCPKGVDPSAMFRQMRAEAVDRGKAPFPEHDLVLAYERRGLSKRYSYYALPAGCSKVLFPGCTLAGTRPAQTFELFEQLRQWDPSLGIVIDCCTKISHDLGRETYFRSAFGEMRDFLRVNGVREVLAACPNCYRIFQAYGQGLKARSIYEVLAELPLARKEGIHGIVSVHDPCVLRGETQIHAAVRKLVRSQGFDLVEMKHSGPKTVCCGEGASAGRIHALFSKRWGEIRKGEAGERLLVTSCAGCAGFLAARTPTVHVLDLLRDPKNAVKGRAKVSRPPFTSLNRLWLKRRLKKSVNASIIRERDLSSGT